MLLYRASIIHGHLVIVSFVIQGGIPYDFISFSFFGLRDIRGITFRTCSYMRSFCTDVFIDQILQES